MLESAQSRALDHVAEALRDVTCDEHLGEAFDAFAVHRVFERLSCGLRMSGGVGIKESFENRRDESQTFAGLQLRRNGQQFVLLQVQRVARQLHQTQELRTPVLRVRRSLFQPQQREAGGRERQPADAVAPLLLGPPVLDVLVDEGGETHCAEGVDPRGEKHDEKTEEDAEEGDGPVEVPEARAPRGTAQEGLDGARQVEEHVAHEEEHGEDGRDEVQVADEDGALGDEQRHQDRLDRLPARVHVVHGLQERDDAVLGDGLQEAGRANQGLKRRPERAQQRPHQDQHGVGPRDERHLEGVLVTSV